MKTTGFVLLCLLFSCSPHGDNHKPIVFTNIGYNTKSLFIFEVNRSDSNSNHMGKDTLGLFCTDLDHPRCVGQKYCQWEFLAMKNGTYRLNEHKCIAGDEWDAIKTCDSELFLHPARERYQVLQFCPYPYFKSHIKIGSKWTWIFKVGKVWAIDSLYPIKANEPITISTEYQLKNTETVSTVFGKLPCYHVEGISSFVYGHSYSTFYLNEDYGLVHFKSKTTQGITYDFTLIKKVSGIDSMKFNGYYDYMYKRAYGMKPFQLN